MEGLTWGTEADVPHIWRRLTCAFTRTWLAVTDMFVTEYPSEASLALAIVPGLKMERLQCESKQQTVVSGGWQLPMNQRQRARMLCFVQRQASGNQ